MPTLAPGLAGGPFDLVITSPPYPSNYDYADATRLEMTFWREIETWGELQGSVRRFIIRSCSQHAAAERLDLDELLADSGIPDSRGPGKRMPAAGRGASDQGRQEAHHTMAAAYFCDLAKV